MNKKDMLNRKKVLSQRIIRLSQVIAIRATEIKKFAPYKTRVGFKIISQGRGGTIKHWRQMAMTSLRRTKQKIEKIKAELELL